MQWNLICRYGSDWIFWEFSHPHHHLQTTSQPQTKHLTFLALDYFDALSPLSRRRLPSSLPLPLSTLTFSLPPPPEGPHNPARKFQPPNRLLTLVFPKFFHFLGRAPPNQPRFHRARRTIIPDIPYLDIAQFPWTNLQTVVLTNAHVNYARFLAANREADVVLPRSFELVQNLADTGVLGWEDRLGEDLLWINAHGEMDVDEESEEGVKVTVLVKSEEKRVAFEAMAKRMADQRELRQGILVNEKTRERLVVKVKEVGMRGLDWEVEDKTLVGEGKTRRVK